MIGEHKVNLDSFLETACHRDIFTPVLDDASFHFWFLSGESGYFYRITENKMSKTSTNQRRLFILQSIYSA